MFSLLKAGTSVRHPAELYNVDVGHSFRLARPWTRACEAQAPAVAGEGGREVERADIDLFGQRHRNRPARDGSAGDVQDAPGPDHPPENRPAAVGREREIAFARGG